MTLSQQARNTIQNWYFGDDRQIRTTVAGYVRRGGWDDGNWHGDTCGCTDDRCIGYHHDATDDCGCLPALLERWVSEQRADLEAAPIWAAYQASLTADGGRRDWVAGAAAIADADAWVSKYQPGAQTFSLDVVVEGRAGISILTRWTSRIWLVWAAPVDVVAGDGVREVASA